MNTAYVITCILIMALVTYIPRAIPIVLFRKKIENRFVRSFLAYVPYAVLAAMTVPDIFFSTSSVVSAAFGLAVALFLAYREKGLLTVAVGATVTVLAVEEIIKIISL